MRFDYKESKLDIIVVAGQSNAEGNGISNDPVCETRNDVFELVDSNNYYLVDNGVDKPYMVYKLPIECKIQCLQERVCEFAPRYSFCMRFVDLYKNSKYYNPSRKIMVIKAAVGGTGFTKNEWGVGSILYNRLLDMVNTALSYNKDNRIVAFLWHQGECDAFERDDFTPKERYDFYHEKFMEQIHDFLTRYNKFSFPVIMGEFCNEWSNKPENFAKTQIIEQCLRDCSKELGNSLTVSSEGLTSNHEECPELNDDIHFSKPASIELGNRYFEAYKILRK